MSDQRQSFIAATSGLVGQSVWQEPVHCRFLEVTVYRADGGGVYVATDAPRFPPQSAGPFVGGLDPALFDEAVGAGRRALIDTGIEKDRVIALMDGGAGYFVARVRTDVEPFFVGEVLAPSPSLLGAGGLAFPPFGERVSIRGGGGYYGNLLDGQVELGPTPQPWQAPYGGVGINAVVNVGAFATLVAPPGVGPPIINEHLCLHMLRLSVDQVAAGTVTLRDTGGNVLCGWRVPATDGAQLNADFAGEALPATTGVRLYNDAGVNRGFYGRLSYSTAVG